MAGHHLCPWWLAYTFDHRLRRYLHDPERILADYVKPGMRVLDLGCGLGYFSIPMARLVGERGRVLAVDIQQPGLDVLMRRARKAGMDRRIQPCLCKPNTACADGPVDFALAFFMVHETPNSARFLEQVSRVVKPGALFLIAEPKLHVKRRDFARMLQEAAAAGFRLVDSPSVRISHTALLAREPMQE